MNLGIVINTPAQVHFFKNIVKELEKKGHKIEILAREYGETLPILKELGMKFLLYGKSPEGKIAKIVDLPIDILRVNNLIKSYNPEMILGFGGQESYSGFLLRCPSVVFQDSEPHINLAYLIQYKMFMPFVDSIITTKSYTDDLGKKQIKINSYKELSYLHPRYFVPDEHIFNLLQIKKNEDFVIVRFNGFDAVHDAGVASFSLEQKRRLISELQKHAHVFISAEKKVPSDLEKYLLPIPKHKIHDCLYYAKMCVTDTQTMTTEAGILGTPVIRCNSFVGKKDMGNFIELEHKYHLIFSYRNPDQAIEQALRLIQEPDIKKEWDIKKQSLLQDKIDITSFLVWYIENYPQSFQEMRKNPEIQNRFT
jgi:predicted glycosyltransferase